MKGTERLPADLSLCISDSAKHLKCKLNNLPWLLLTDALTICFEHLIAAADRNLKPQEKCDEANNEEVASGCVRIPGGGGKQQGVFLSLSSEREFFRGSSIKKRIHTAKRAHAHTLKRQDQQAFRAELNMKKRGFGGKPWQLSQTQVCAEPAICQWPFSIVASQHRERTHHAA